MKYLMWLYHIWFKPNYGLDIIAIRLRSGKEKYVTLWDSRLEALHWFHGTGQPTTNGDWDQPFDIRVTTAYAKGYNHNNRDNVVSPDLLFRLGKLSGSNLTGLTTIHIDYPISMVLNYLRYMSGELRRDQLYPLGAFYIGYDFDRSEEKGMVKLYNQSHQSVNLPMSLIRTDFLITVNPLEFKFNPNLIVPYDRGLV